MNSRIYANLTNAHVFENMFLDSKKVHEFKNKKLEIYLKLEEKHWDEIGKAVRKVSRTFL